MDTEFLVCSFFPQCQTTKLKWLSDNNAYIKQKHSIVNSYVSE